MMNVLFVNSGILGMKSFATVMRETLARDPEIHATHVVLTENLTPSERLIRRGMCVRLWRDGLFGVRNLDLARWRAEWHAGVQAARRIHTVLETERIDAIHFHRQPTAYASLGLMTRVPTIVSIDSTQDIVLDAARSTLERWSYLPNAARDGLVFARARAVVSTSRWAAECLRRRYPRCSTPVHVMPTPVRSELFDSAWVDERHARAGTPGFLPRVLFIGGDFPRKGGPRLLDVWRRGGFAATATLDLVTNWPEDLPDLPGLRVLRGVEPYSPAWLELWRRADIFVLPTRQEAFATVFQEAAAAGLPRIGTDLAAVPETIRHGETGLLIAPDDSDALAGALRQLIASADLRRRFGRAAQEAIAGSTPDRYAAGLRAIVRDVVSSRAA